MSATKEAQAFGNMLMEMFAEFKRAEASLPDGFEPAEVGRVIGTIDRDWRISVSRPSEDDEACTPTHNPRKGD